ncbi:MAG: family 43 glycosylhydrolase [Bacteroidales bacterium]|nr:family 43 glycosylhydrolase [Bacteroidales bacterium]
MKSKVLILMGLCAGAAFADVPYNAPGALNPVIPGYFADPTVKKFGDDYYIYATTDGSGAGFGPAQLWTSKDFVNWTLMPMNWPDTHWIWAPDVMQSAYDGKYYYLYCQPCTLHMGVSDTPRGPWVNVLGDSDAVLVPDRFVENAITLDGQTFVDDDGSVYMYWGTWGIYKGFGAGSGKLNPDMKTFSETRLIPNTEIIDFFEAPFVLKRDSTYYFMYSSESCHNETYHVQYATSKNPLGPYEYKGTILKTNEDGTVHGPGHHSILKDGDDYYILYHRHDNPHSNRGFHRQLCLDKMEFDADGNIKPVTPTHQGIGALAPSVLKSNNIAYQAKVKASSYYDEDFKPSYAVDDNNGTLWRPKTNGMEWIEIDLGKPMDFQTIWTQWEYGTQFYQYLIETSLDGENWTVFADKRDNRLAGSPMVDFGKANAQYIRITFLNGQKAGFPGAIWNVKVFPAIEDACPQQWLGLTAADWNGTEWKNNEGMLGGSFTLKSGKVDRQRRGGIDYLVLQPGTKLVYENPVIDASRPYTASALVMDEHGYGRAYDLAHNVANGTITLEAGDKPLAITNVSFYNWEKTQAERDFDAVSIVRKPAANNELKGLVVNINFNNYNDGDTVPYFENINAAVEGYFEALRRPAVIEEIKGKKALKMTGEEVYTSSFGLPTTLLDNAPYTLEAWILNPEIAENECIADFTTTHDELEKIMMVNGTEPRCGVMNHYGWFEDAGYPDVKDLAGEWQHIYVCFDGRIEKVYINDKLVSEKDIQLLIKPSQFITIGRNAEHEWPFTGYINSIRLWDEYIPY